MKINLSLYWWCQIIIWCASVFIGSFFYFATPAFTILNSYPAIPFYATVGMFLMHMMHLFIKARLLPLNFSKQIIRLILITIFFAIIQSLITIELDRLFKWEKQPFRANSFGSKMLLFSFSNFFFYGIWSLGHFTYYYMQKSRSEQIDKIRLQSELKAQQLESEKAKSELEAIELRSQMNEMQKLQQMRTQIASDLHDDIGSTLNSVSFYSEIVKMQLPAREDNLTSLLDKIGNNARNAVSAMSDIVWMINPDNDVTGNLITKMKNHAAELCSDRNIVCNFETEEINELKLDMLQRKNIYLVYKEALHNAVKYSGSNTIAICFSKKIVCFI
jgi:signal transduction histidine kinase